MMSNSEERDETLDGDFVMSQPTQKLGESNEQKERKLCKLHYDLSK